MVSGQGALSRKEGTTMSTPIATRLACVGAGNHCSECLYSNPARLPECDLVAVCDRPVRQA